MLFNLLNLLFSSAKRSPLRRLKKRALP